jgi:hypothetical protein
MSKSPKTRKNSRNVQPAKSVPAGKFARTARRSATSGKAAAKSGRRRNGTRRGARPMVRDGTKQALLIDLLGAADGASVPEMAAKTGWQPHSVRGAISGTLKKKLGLTVESEVVEDRGRVYRIAARG